MGNVVTVSCDPDDTVTSRELVGIAQSETTRPRSITTTSDEVTINRPDGRTLELTVEVGEGENEQGEEIHQLDTLTLSNESEYGNVLDEMDHRPVVDEIVEWIND